MTASAAQIRNMTDADYVIWRCGITARRMRQIIDTQIDQTAGQDRHDLLLLRDVCGTMQETLRMYADEKEEAGN